MELHNFSKKKAFNPAGTKGLAFLEFSTPNEKSLEKMFTMLGFKKLADSLPPIQHFQQNGIDFLINQHSDYATLFAEQHGPAVCAMGFWVEDAEAAFQRAVKFGAKAFLGPSLYSAPAIYGIGGTLIHFIDDTRLQNLPLAIHQKQNLPVNPGEFLLIDHLTHNVNPGQMAVWVDFYERIFGFREIRYFDIKGKKTGLYSKAMTSPCGNIKIPINEASDEKSQIAEFIKELKGEGIQHIALSTENIYQSVENLRQKGIAFLKTPATYYQNIRTRVPWHQEPEELLQDLQILLDGGATKESGLLLQIFTENLLGPTFFEIIQRKGHEGFGEGNFQALFEAIERDQIERGVL